MNHESLMKILLVEDDEPTVHALVKVLTEQHYVVEAASDGQMGWEMAEVSSYDLVLLDVMLPKLDGISLCRRLRSHHYQMPILLLTAKDSITDKIIGLDAGADDYVIKPFDLQELLARIRVLLRRGGTSLATILEWGELRLNPVSCEVSYQEQVLNLSPKEYQLLELFLRNPQRVFSRNAILEHLWTIAASPNEGTITSHIMGLRKKIKMSGAGELIETVYGLGYRLKTLELLKKDTEFISKIEKTAKQIRNREKTVAVVNKVWDQFKDKVQERVAIFDRVVEALANDTMTSQLQRQAAQEAHKLAGSLGIFGFMEGTRTAKTIEHLLQSPAAADQVEEITRLTRALKQELESPPNQHLTPLEQTEQIDHVLLVDDDTELAARLKLEAANSGICLEVASNLADARRSIARRLPDGVLLDLALADQSGDGFTLLAELSTQMPAVPAIVFSASDSFGDRLKAARLRVQGFLHKTIPPAQVLAAVKQILNRKHNTEATILIVNDDSALLSSLQTLLEPWGLHLITVNDPQKFWTMLDEIAPDLVILDVQLPQMNGIELCKVIRNEMRWCELPILFLTAHKDAETVHQIFAAGADDFVSKPIIGPELVARIMGRLERLHLLQRSW